MVFPRLTGPAVLAVFKIAKDGAAAALLKTQLMSAPMMIAVLGIVMLAVVEVATGFTEPVTLALLSVQVTPDDFQAVLKLSVRTTAVPVAVAIRLVGVVGVAVETKIVEILANVPVRFISAKLNGPPVPPVVIFCTDTNGRRRLVIVQTMFDPAAVAATSSVTTLPASDAVPPAPMPVQLCVVISQGVPPGRFSVNCVDVAAAVNMLVLPLVGVPTIVVVMF